MKKKMFGVILIALIFSCTAPITEVTTVTSHGSDSVKKGNVNFSLAGSNRATVIPPSEDVDAVVVTIEDLSGNIIADSYRCTLYDMGWGNYISESIMLNTGSYNLTKFLVIDADNNILYAAPLSGSPKAYLVNDPLPIDFTVQDNKTTALSVQVVDAEGAVPEDFGYVTFSFEVVEEDDDNLFKNGSFNSGASYWDCFINNTGAASMEIINGEAKITITNQGLNIWDVGLAQGELNIESGCTYELSFDARSTSDRIIKSVFQLQQDPWTPYDQYYFDITTGMTTYTYTFTMNYSTNENTGFNFHLGSTGTGEIYFDNLVLRKLADIPQAASSGLYRGINLSNALDAPTEGEWEEVLEGSYFNMIKNTGFDHVRIPIRWSTRALYDAPYTLDASFFDRVDWAINNALTRGMKAVIDMHHYHELFGTEPEDSPVYPSDVVLGPENNKDRFLAMWIQIADHYKDYPADLYFEILNEPNTDLTPALWNEYLLEAYNIIRSSNPTRKIIIGTANWGGLWGLNDLEIPANDPNIIVTFHYYEPLELCFQGAEWIPGSDQWLGTTWEGTEEEKQKIRDDFNNAVQWAKNNGNVPLWLGEFHVIKHAEQSTRIRWITYVAREAEKRGIGWTYWGFCSNEAGIYDENTGIWDTDIVNCLIPD